MEKRYLVGIDVGTTGVKVIAFDLEGQPIVSAYQEYGCIYPKVGWVEQDFNQLIQAVYDSCAGVFAGGKIHPEEVYSVSVSAQRSCTIFMDRQGNPLKMISWLDNRAGEEVEEIAEKVGREHYYEITGMPLSTTWIFPKILHTRKNDPALWEQTGKIIQLQDLIIRALGVEGYYSNEPEASFYGMWDSKKRCYSQELLKAFDLDPALLPQMRLAGEVVGQVNKFAAEKSGLCEGTPICVGLGDQNSAALGAGVVNPGDASVSIGTGGLATVMLSECYRDPKGQAMVTGHAMQGYWTFEGLQNAAAGAFRWFRDEVAAFEKAEAKRTGSDPYVLLNELIEKSPVGANGLLMLPYFAGSAAPRWNAEARGGFWGLTLAHNRGDMARACMEGITLEQKDILSSLGDSVSLKKVRIVGGATNSEIWNQMQADMYGLPCETLQVKDAAALGAAISAGVGAGIFSSVREGAERMVRVNKTYLPNPERVEKYNKLYEVYCATYDALQNAGIFGKLKEL